MISPEDEVLISDEIQAEGGLVDDPNDPGGATFEGISKVANPEAWAKGVPSDVQVRQIYETKYLKATHIDQIPDLRLRHQVLDFFVNSGYPAIMRLQTILGVSPDGGIGPDTLAALAQADPVVVNNRLVDARVMLLVSVVVKNPKMLGDLYGLINRALSFRI